MSTADSHQRIRAIDAPEGHHKIIKNKWRAFADFARRKYEAEGRGAIVIDLRNASESERGLRFPTYYVAESSRRLAARGGWPSDEVAQAVEEYDPHQDVVFIFLRVDGDFLHYMVSDDYPFSAQGESQ